MIHHASAEFWSLYSQLPSNVRALADRAFELLKDDPHHPSIRLKKINKFWSARVGLHYRVLGVTTEDGGFGLEATLSTTT